MDVVVMVGELSFVPSSVVIWHDHDAVDATVLEGSLGDHVCISGVVMALVWCSVCEEVKEL